MDDFSKSIGIIALIFYVSSLLAEPHAAASNKINSTIPPLKITQPINCILGQTCYVRQYVNVGQEAGDAYDYKGGFLTSAQQNGTDFALQTYHQMNKGVAVLAPAAGTVIAIRENLFDQHNNENKKSFRQKDPYKRINQKDYCGNYVAIDHGHGWTTQLCHLRQHSIRVAPGQSIHKGQLLGLVGSSGKTDGPYLHFQLRYNNAVVDPFQSQLWEPAIPYHATGIIDHGISPKVLDLKSVQQKASHYTKLTPLNPSMVAWVRLYGVHKGDVQRFIFIQPDGLIYGKPIINNIDKDYKEWFSYGGYPIDSSFTNSLLGNWTVLYQMAHSDEEDIKKQQVQWKTIVTFHFTMATDSNKSAITPI